MRLACILLAVLLAALAGPAWAHKPSDSYLVLHQHDATVQVQWSIAVRDLEDVVGLDADGDGQVTWGEMQAKRQAIVDYAFGRLGLAADGAACRLAPPDLLVDQLLDGAYAVLRFDAACGGAPERLVVTYGLLFNIDRQHRGLLSYIGPAGGRPVVGVLSPDTPTMEIAAGTPGDARFGHFFVEGMHHLFTGYDHMLFLAMVLLPGVMRRTAKGWEPTDDFWRAFRDCIAILTAFTVAHSLTLASAALGVVTLPSRLVESGIALTIIATAADNVWPFLGRRRWVVAFCFGLIHGFGFASALGPLGVSGMALATALLGFNLGLEAGQVLLAGLVLPFAFMARGRAVFIRRIVPAGSAIAAAIALVWFLERAFDLDVLGI